MMSRWPVVVLFGFLLGLRHALDPDHLVAMSAIVSRAKRFGTSWLLGAFWGLGHTLTLLAVGAAIILLKGVIPPRLGAGMEFAVGIMLVVLGVMNLAGRGLGAMGVKEHSHEHEHDGKHSHHLPGGDPETQHIHVHAHSEPLERLFRETGSFQILRAFGVGLIHGLAGSSAVVLLVLAAIPDPGVAVAYLLIFGLGTLAGMVALSSAMEWAMFWAARRFPIMRWTQSGAGMVSLTLGLYIMYETGFVGWTPH